MDEKTWNFKMGKILGIDVYLHWSFMVIIGILLPLYLFLNGENGGMIFKEVFLIVGVFLSIFLHELGHCIVAREFGIETLRITILPYGARGELNGFPTRVRDQIWVAVAGPLVNITAAIFMWVEIRVGLGTESLAALFHINVVLGLFNLLPVFPMDGGRILCALLSLKLETAHATRIAARLGQFVAVVGFVVAAICLQIPILGVIGIVVFLQARNEVSKFHP